MRLTIQKTKACITMTSGPEPVTQKRSPCLTSEAAWMAPARAGGVSGAVATWSDNRHVLNAHTPWQADAGGRDRRGIASADDTPLRDRRIPSFEKHHAMRRAGPTHLPFDLTPATVELYAPPRA